MKPQNTAGMSYGAPVMQGQPMQQQQMMMPGQPQPMM